MIERGRDTCGCLLKSDENMEAIAGTFWPRLRRKSFLWRGRERKPAISTKANPVQFKHEPRYLYYLEIPGTESKVGVQTALYSRQAHPGSHAVRDVHERRGTNDAGGNSSRIRLA